MAGLAFYFALGLWLSFTALAGLWPWVAPVLGHTGVSGKEVGLGWAALINMVPALLGFVGFFLGSFTFGAKARGPARAGLKGATLGLGFLFPLTLWALRPLLATFNAGLMPSMVWAVLGSFVLALLFGVLFTRK